MQNKFELTTQQSLPTITLIVAAADGDVGISEAEQTALAKTGLAGCESIRPKERVGNLFAAAAGVQLVLAAALASQRKTSVLANCFGHGTEHASFWLEAA